MPETTRFAPSPNGPLHLGHAFAALTAEALADVVHGGRFLVRIEDIDTSRARPEFEAA
ncbi:MAG: glutamate--tRNA ligase family protein, partial [Alphaproteobacteria bacterium]|nr:glutamate--tRNA ligase family protein [Alphaproteobacteria bacterium]MDX5370379.1 glutamate--tRNA ligase family protein [Alphaproteobacteria bacterium]MDX5464894.1 glutamate--tRNA ligase family protein [Alphaproteobacteria bacterium]